jgi:hypothetical protein
MMVMMGGDEKGSKGDSLDMKGMIFLGKRKNLCLR